MNVIITGGFGLIGSHLARHMIQVGHEVIVLDNLSGNIVKEIEGVDTVLIGDADDIHALWPNHIDAVVHCAAPVGPAGILRHQSIAHAIVDQTHYVAEFCEDRHAAMINISTSEVYGYTGTYTEDDVCQVPSRYSPRMEYAVGKLCAEQVVAAWESLKSMTIRPFNVTGPGQSAEKGFVLPNFLEQAIAGEPLQIFGNGTARRAITSVHDFARFTELLTSRMVAAPEQPRYIHRTVNVGNANNITTINALARRVLAVTGSDSEIEYTEGTAIYGRQWEEAEGDYKLPDSRWAQELGWAPSMNLDDIVQDMYDYYT